MFRLGIVLVFTSTLATAQTPAAKQAELERKELLAELGIRDRGQKLPRVPFEWLADPVAESDLKADPKRYALRIACRSAAKVLLEQQEKPLPETYSFVGGPKRAKDSIKAVQKIIATRTLDLEEALDALDEAKLPKKPGEPSKRWQLNRRYLMASIRQELVILNEYNTALARVITDVVEPPPVNEETNALKLQHVPKMMSQKAVQEQAKVAASEFEAIETSMKETPWAILAETAKNRPLGLTWVPTKVEPPKKKK